MSKQNFRVKRSGYDRFEVDQYLQKLEHDIEVLQKQNALYRKRIDLLLKQRSFLKEEYDKVLSDLSIKEKAAEEMARIALQEANVIIERAYDNADMIVQEAMSSARQILVEIARISNQSHELREELQGKIQQLNVVIDDLALPQAPSLKYLGDEQDASKK